jgi:hypothetical protein
MKKLLGIVVLGLLLSGNAIADKPLKKILDLYSNKIDNLNKSQHLFYSTELAVASRKIKEVGIPCFRSTLINKENYNKTVDCLNFRILLGDDSDEWEKYLSKIGLIAKKNRELLKNDKWVNEWNSNQFDEYGKNIKELVGNIAIMNELLEYISE